MEYLIYQEECVACGKKFRNDVGLKSHWAMKESCKWLKKGKLSTLQPINSHSEGGAMTIQDETPSTSNRKTAGPSRPNTRSRACADETPLSADSLTTDVVENTEEDEYPEDVVEEFYPEEPFHFLPEECGPSSPEIGQAGPGPSTMAMRAGGGQAPDVQNMFRSLDDDQDETVVEEHPTAGGKIRMNKDLHQRWQDLFGPGKDREGDVIMGEGTIFTSGRANGFAPFASELDWRVANWAIKEDIGQNSFNRLLAIPGVSFYSTVMLLCAD